MSSPQPSPRHRPRILSVAVGLLLAAGLCLGAAAMLVPHDSSLAHPADPATSATPAAERTTSHQQVGTIAAQPTARASGRGAGRTAKRARPARRPQLDHGWAPRPVTSENAQEAAVVRLTNAERKQAGCGPLTVDPRLVSAARGHSQDMAKNDYFDHDSPDGATPGDRISAAGYPWVMWAENIAAGQPDAASVVNAWMNSAGHRENIVNCTLRNIGVGVAPGVKNRSTYAVYWTQDFGTPQ